MAEDFTLALFDVDSTLTNEEAIDLLAERAGHGAEVSAITERAMKGELDFDQALIQRVALLEGLPLSTVTEVAESMTFTAGAFECFTELKRRGFVVGMVSGGFIELISQLFKNWEFDFVRANSLSHRDGALTGEINGKIINRAGKAEALRAFATAQSVDLSKTIAIGDGANDIDMLHIAGLGVAFRGKEALREYADVVIKENMLELIDYLDRR